MLDYGDLIFSERYKLDQKSYTAYYMHTEKSPLTFNKWYGTDSHKKYLNIFLRKLKLEKINNAQ